MATAANETELNKAKSSLQTIPDKLLTQEACCKIQTIILSQNHLNTFTCKFQLECLTVLALGVNNLHEFPDLSCAKNLKELYLNNNFIKEIERSKLDILTELELLDLRQNRLEIIDFPDSLCNLKWLSLSGNQLREIRHFPTLSYLKTLCIFGNSNLPLIDCIGILQKTPFLRKLVAGGTALSNIPLATIEQKNLIFCYLKQLEWLGEEAAMQ